jgi:cytochrome oxidase complex assembly protein 1
MGDVPKFQKLMPWSDRVEHMANPVSLPPKLQNRNAWSRNWKWLAPVGCVGVVILFAGFAALIMAALFGAIKSSDAYKIPVATAKADPRVINAIGSPVKERFFVNGSIHISGPSGEADLSIPISGPEGKGTIYVVATKAVGKWSFSNLVFQAKGSSNRIDLNEKAPSQQ